MLSLAKSASVTDFGRSTAKLDPEYPDEDPVKL